jgi:hypothetical protein
MECYVLGWRRQALPDFPCMGLHGTLDYCESHKNSRWHGYAAAASARQGFFFSHMRIVEGKHCLLAQEVKCS